MIPIHVGGQPALSVPMLGAVAVAVAGSGLLLGLGLAALLRRRSWSYLLVAGALAALFARAGVAALSMAAMVGPVEHHLLEHGLDAVMVAMVVGAVLHARSIENERDADATDGDRSGTDGDGTASATGTPVAEAGSAPGGDSQ